jgi:acetyl-CoA C-acetyltransferase
MPEAVYIMGAGRTDFKRNLKKEDKTIRHIILEAAQAAIGDAAIDPKDIQAGIVGNFASGLYTRQLHLGAFLVELDPKLQGLPTMHTEAACASGGVAVLAAAQQIMGGLRDVVLVVGAEQQKTMAPAQGADVLAAAGDYHLETPRYGEHMFPKLFARIAQTYERRYGLTEQQLAQVTAKNHAHARLNPLAQMRDSTLTLKDACTASEENPRFAPPLKVTDCSQITDGAAALLLCSERFIKKMARQKPIRLVGYGHTTDYLPLDRKDIPDFTMSRKAAEQAYDMAALRPGEIRGAEVHDCFSISEIVAYEILGFAEPGYGGKLAESGATSLSKPGTAPVVNAGGGLIGDGHPVGATGVRQVVEAYTQLTEKAARRQISDLKHFLTFNMGGSMTTNVVMIWGIHI